MAEPGNLSISLRRTGGLLPGQVLEATVRGEELGSAEGRRFRELMVAADIPALAARSPITGLGADMYQYELTVREDGQEDRILVAGNSMPQELRSLIRLIEGHASGRRAARGAT